MIPNFCNCYEFYPIIKGTMKNICDVIYFLWQMETKNVPEILSVGLRIHKCHKDFFLAYRVLCVKLTQQVNVASFSILSIRRYY